MERVCHLVTTNKVEKPTSHHYQEEEEEQLELHYLHYPLPLLHHHRDFQLVDP